MTATSATMAARANPQWPAVIGRAWFLWLGALAMVLPTLYGLTQEFWPLEDGAHGPLIFASGLWAFYRGRHKIAEVATPGHPALTGLLLAGSLLVYVFGNVTGWLGVKCLGMYGAGLAVFYYHLGLGAVLRMWFPLAYLLFMFPPPESLILPTTHALKLFISGAAVHLLAALGYPIGEGGVVIYIDRYELLVETACSGMNSVIGLTAICLLYCYMNYEGRWRESLPLIAVIVPIALISNFVRLIILILVTYYFGDRVAQRFVHDVAAILLFTMALASMFLADYIFHRLRRRTAR